MTLFESQIRLAAELPVGTTIQVGALRYEKAASNRWWSNIPIDGGNHDRSDTVVGWWLHYRPEKCEVATPEPDDHQPWPADWHPFSTVHCGDCGREIEQDQATDGDGSWGHLDV